VLQEATTEVNDCEEYLCYTRESLEPFGANLPLVHNLIQVPIRFLGPHDSEYEFTVLVDTVEQVSRVSMEDLTQAHAEGYASSMLSVSVELEDFVEAYHDCTDFKDIYKSLSTSTDFNPQHVYPEYCIGQDGLLCFNDGLSIRTSVSSSKRAYILKLMHDLPLGLSGTSGLSGNS
jgi:hypothetical protein